MLAGSAIEESPLFKALFELSEILNREIVMEVARLVVRALALSSMLFSLSAPGHAKPSADAAGIAIQRQMERHPPAAGNAEAGKVKYLSCVNSPAVEGSPFDCAAFKRSGTQSDVHRPSASRAKPRPPSLNYFGEGCDSGCTLGN